MDFAVDSCLLRPGPTAEKPITFVVIGKKSEEGEASRFEMDLSTSDADELARGLRRSAQWVHEGVWRPGAPSYLDPLK